MKSKILALVLAVAMILGCMSVVAFAASVTITDGYIAQNGDVLTGGTGVELIEIADDAEITLSGVNVQRITLKGDAIINLADGTINNVNSNRTKDGAVVVPKGGSLVINGNDGVLNAAKGTSSYSAAIGSDRWGSVGSVTITINGGVINAEANYAAAIGGGQEMPATVIINGGTINAKSDYGAAIGGGQDAAATVTIGDGTVTAISSRGAAIGGGQRSDATVAINGGTISAQGLFGTAIGAGSDSTGTTNVSINNAVVTATVDPATHTSNPSSTRGITSAAIGASNGKAEITIADSTVNATSVNAPAIGGGLNSAATSTVAISGASDVDVMVFAPDVEIANIIGNANGSEGEGVTIEGNASVEEVLPVAKIDGTSYDKYYTSLEAAIAEGGEITLLGDGALENANIKKDTTIDLNGNTLNVNATGIMDTATGAVAAIQAWSDVVITNGNVVVSVPAKINNGVFYIANRDDASLTISDVNLTATNTNGTDVFVCCNPGTLSIIDSVINASGVGKAINGGDGGNATITRSKINVSDSERAMVNILVDADDSEINISNLSDNALRNVSGSINNTKINANGYASGIKNDAGLNLDVTGNSVVTLTGAKVVDGEAGYDLYLKDGATLTVEETATFVADDVYVAADDAVTGNVASKADTVYVQFKQVDVDANGNDTVEGSDEYKIILAGADEADINELASADLTFDFVGTPVAGGAMKYTVAPEEGVSLSQLGDRYMFNYNGVDKYEETGKAIVIGTIKIEGYGAYTLATANVETNAVYATEIRNNIVDGFTPAAGLVINEDMVANDGMVGNITDGNVAVPTRVLEVNVAFPNNISDKVASYQDMEVTISGGDLDEAIVIELGSDVEETLLNIANKAGAKYDVDFANNAYKVTVTNALKLNTTYVVTVTGEGYRTSRYSVTMTDTKSLYFWNNVMDDLTYIEEGKGTPSYTSFLAGDIVADDNINIFDLSAVVSYFGENNLVEGKPEYVKYDLNRDGKIDSKDVAYVLVSWNN